MPQVLNQIPIPVSDPIAQIKRRQQFKYEQDDPLENRVTNTWIEYFNNQTQTIDLTQTRVNSIQSTAQAVSIGATDMSGGTISAGLYVLMYYAAITQAASVSSSLTVTLDWKDAGVVKTYTGAAITGNTNSTYQSGAPGFGTAAGPGMIYIDGGSPVRYATTYGSVGGTPMQYKIYVTLSRVQA